MSTRAFVVAATAVSACFVQAQWASALTPLSIDASLAETPAGASPFASAPPSAFAAPPIEVLAPSAEVLRSGPRLQCVPFVRRETGVEIYGDANTWWEQARGRYEREDDPEAGSVMVMRGYRTTARGHVAVVRAVISDRVIIVDHANWLNAGEITRDVPVRDVSEAGDWSEVQVWNIPTRQWGVRRYNVQGFILNVLTAEAQAQAAALAQQASASASEAAIPVG